MGAAMKQEPYSNMAEVYYGLRDHYLAELDMPEEDATERSRFLVAEHDRLQAVRKAGLTAHARA
jgi:hypothetical protein